MIREYIGKRPTGSSATGSALRGCPARHPRHPRRLPGPADRGTPPDRRRPPVVIVVMMMDRFGRDRVERLRAWDELRRSASRSTPSARGAPDRRPDRRLQGADRQLRGPAVGSRIRNVFDFLHVRGWYHVGKAPWGYPFRPPTPEERAAQSPKAVLDLAAPRPSRRSPRRRGCALRARASCPSRSGRRRSRGDPWPASPRQHDDPVDVLDRSTSDVGAASAKTWRTIRTSTATTR